VSSLQTINDQFSKMKSIVFCLALVAILSAPVSGLNLTVVVYGDSNCTTAVLSNNIAPFNNSLIPCFPQVGLPAGNAVSYLDLGFGVNATFYTACNGSAAITTTTVPYHYCISQSGTYVEFWNVSAAAASSSAASSSSSAASSSGSAGTSSSNTISSSTGPNGSSSVSANANWLAALFLIAMGTLLISCRF